MLIQTYDVLCLSICNQGKHHWIRQQYMEALRGSYCTLEFSEKLKEDIWILLQPVLLKAAASLLFLFTILFLNRWNLNKEQYRLAAI